MATRNIPLTAKEHALLLKLYENRNRIVTSDALCQAAWGDDYYGYENTLMVHIRRIREKVEDNPSNPGIFTDHQRIRIQADGQRGVNMEGTVRILRRFIRCDHDDFHLSADFQLYIARCLGFSKV